MILEAACVCVHAVARAQSTGLLNFNAKVLVLGTGPIGLLMCSVLRAAGINHIVAIDGSEKRLEMAKKLGVKTTINFKEVPDAAARVQIVKDISDDQGVDEALASVEGKEIVFGFRPEAIDPGVKDESYVMRASVELTELLGDNTNVYVDMAEDKAILKVDPREAPLMDTEFEFSVPYKSVYVFDAETEMVIGR